MPVPAPCWAGRRTFATLPAPLSLGLTGPSANLAGCLRSLRVGECCLAAQDEEKKQESGAKSFLQRLEEIEKLADHRYARRCACASSAACACVA